MVLLPRIVQSARVGFRGYSSGTNVPMRMLNVRQSSQRSMTARTFLTRRNMSTKPAAEGAEAAKESAETQISTKVTFAEGAKAGVSMTFKIGAAGLALGCLYLIGTELMPTKMSPNSLFNKTVDSIHQNPELTSRIGSPVKAYGRDYGQKREGRRYFVDHDEYTDIFGNRRLRVKFNVEGPNGKGKIFAEVASNTPPGEFEYIIFQRNLRGRSEAIALVENRKEPTKEEKQKAIAAKFQQIGLTLFGRDEGCAWTKRQKEEFGQYAGDLPYLACDKPENAELCAGIAGTPIWANQYTRYEGFKTLDQLYEIAQKLK